ncbi:MAG: hypothetical protein IKZ58_01645 [Selenomonadaceae bacterium]|nr:hypothetical protein [Selenomonadaceae bacterium]
MFFKLKMNIAIIFAIIFCFFVKCEAFESDLIANPNFILTMPTPIAHSMNDSIFIGEVSLEEILLDKKSIELSKLGKISRRQHIGVIERENENKINLDANKILVDTKEIDEKNFPVYHKNIKSLQYLYAINFAAKDEFDNFMNDLQKELGGRLIKRPDIKSKRRVREKAELECGGDYSKITDLWAASLIYPNEKELLSAFEKIKSRENIVRIKDNWNNPLPQGYRDIKLNFELSNGAIVELQLHHEAILQVNYNIDHHIYEFIRANRNDSEMKNYVERAKNCQKILYGSVWNEKFKKIDESDKKILG